MQSSLTVGYVRVSLEDEGVENWVRAIEDYARIPLPPLGNLLVSVYHDIEPRFNVMSNLHESAVLLLITTQ